MAEYHVSYSPGPVNGPDDLDAVVEAPNAAEARRMGGTRFLRSPVLVEAHRTRACNDDCRERLARKNAGYMQGRGAS